MALVTRGEPSYMEADPSCEVLALVHYIAYISWIAHFETTTKDPEKDGELITSLGALGTSDRDGQAVLLDVEYGLEELRVNDLIDNLRQKLVRRGVGKELGASRADARRIKDTQRRPKSHGRLEAQIAGGRKCVGNSVEGLSEDAVSTHNRTGGNGDSRGGPLVQHLGRGLSWGSRDPAEEGQRGGKESVGKALHGDDVARSG